MAIPNVTEKRAAEAQQKKQEIYQQAIASGASEQDAVKAAEGSGYGSTTPRLDKMAFDEEQRQERLAEETAGAPPVKKDLRVAQLIRKFKGQAPLAETPEQFAAQINTSAGYGEKSAMFTPAGVARAVESGVASGLSPVQARAQIDAATASILKDVGDRARITSGLTGSALPPISTAGLTPFAPTGKATPAATTKPYVFQGPPESAKPTGGASTTTAETTEAVERISGAPESDIGRAASIGGVAQIGVSRGLGLGASLIDKKVADLTRTAIGKTAESAALDAAGEVALKGSADLTEAAKLTKQQALAADRMSKVAQGLVTPDEVASNADELKRLKQIASQKVDPTAYVKNAQLAKDKANLAYKAAKDAEAALEGTVMGLAGKSGDVAVEAAEITAQAGKATKAGETLRKIAGSKLVKGVGKAAGIVDLATMGIEGYGLATDENLRKQRVAELEEAAKGSDYLSGKGAAQGFFNPVGTLYGFGALVGQRAESKAAAKEAEAGARKAEETFNARLEARRKLISDEDFEKLAQKERSALMASVRKANK
jgi:hypothetical protein